MKERLVSLVRENGAAPERVLLQMYTPMREVIYLSRGCIELLRLL